MAASLQIITVEHIPDQPVTDSLYLFVNHANPSIKPLSRRTIASHAQRNSKRLLTRSLPRKRYDARTTSSLVGWRHKPVDSPFTPELSRSSSSSTSTPPSHRDTPDSEERQLSPRSEDDIQSLSPEETEPLENDHVATTLEVDFYNDHFAEDVRYELFSSIDSLSGAVIPMDNFKQKVIVYFSNAWLPSDRSLPKNCHIWGFAPVGKRDNNLSVEIVSGALQSSDRLHFLSLMAVTTSRMRWLKLSQSQASAMAPETFVIKSIRALRMFLDSGLPPNEKVLQSLAFLTLAEFFAGSVRSGVYWKLIRQLVIAAGGFGKISPFVSHILIATDWKVSAAFVKPPIFDFTKSPGLLGIDNIKSSDTGIEDAILYATLTMDPRVRVRVNNSVTLFKVINAIHSMPQEITDRICKYVSHFQAIQYVYCAHCLRTVDSSSSQPSSSDQIANIDLLEQRTKALAFRLWLWNITLGFARDSVSMTVLEQHKAEFVGDCSEMLANLAHAEQVLRGTDWQLDQKTLVWKLAVAMSVAVKTEEVTLATVLMRRVTSALGIASATELEQYLSGQLPLGRLPNFDAMRIMQQVNPQRKVKDAHEAFPRSSGHAKVHENRIQFSQAEHAALLGLGQKRTLESVA